MVPAYVFLSEILLLSLLSARVLTYTLSLFYTPGTLVKNAFGSLFGEFLHEDEISGSRWSKPQRSQINNFASAVLAFSLLITVVLIPENNSRTLGLTDAGIIANLTDAVLPKPHETQPFMDWVGISKAFGLIFIGECGDKTFFVAMILAMKYGKLPVFIGAMAALALMTVLAVAVGWILVGMVRAIVGDYTIKRLKFASGQVDRALLVWIGAVIFLVAGFWMLWDAYNMTDEGSAKEVPASIPLQ
jgi:hypothetical protein